MPLYVGKYAICTFLQNMRNMLRSHDRYKPVSLIIALNRDTSPSSKKRCRSRIPGSPVKICPANCGHTDMEV